MRRRIFDFRFPIFDFGTRGRAAQVLPDGRRRFPNPKSKIENPKSTRRGFTLVELTVGAILLTALMVTAIPTLAWVGRVRRSAERQQVAVLAVGNLMERITTLAWDEVTQDALAATELPNEVSRQLPDADLRVSVLLVPGPVEAKRVLIELRWREPSAGMQSAPIRLAAWIYRIDREVS